MIVMMMHDDHDHDHSADAVEKLLTTLGPPRGRGGGGT